jgi:D-amino-acid dehydrogenase
MHVAVLGAGITGITTAYYLSESGHSVTVFDSDAKPACGASGDNGGQLSYSFTDAMANPSFLLKMPRVLAGLDPAFLVRPGLSLDMARWGLGFLAQCTHRKSLYNTLEILRLAARSSALMDELRSAVPVEFSFRQAGKLVLLSDQAQMDAAAASIRSKRAEGCELEMVSPEKACEIEPALNGFSHRCKAAIWSEADEVGDTRAFTIGLSRWLAEQCGVDLRFNTKVDGLDVRSGTIRGVRADDTTVAVDAVVICLGAWSPQLLKPLGLKLNIYPVRGYSITLPAGNAAASVSITELSSKIVFSRINGSVRVAGFADFTGFNTHRDSERARQLFEKARVLAPALADYEAPEHHQWAGFRPMTPDSRPRVGQTHVKGLFLNTGHGMLGWTLACATGRDVADEVGKAAG